MAKSAAEHGTGELWARALWFPAAGTCEIRDEALAAPGKDAVLIETLFSGISRGTEALVFAGRVPASEQERMRGPNMAGTFAFPVKYGYAAVGRVVNGPDNLLEKIVFCLHPHQDRFVVPEALVTPLPADLPPARAVLAANMETALNIVWDAAILPGDRVAVFGAGVVGALVAYLSSRIVGTDTVLVDPNPARGLLADQLGLAFTHPDGLAGEYDRLVNASASADALATALDHAGQEARIVEASWYGDTSAKIPLGGAFHSRRLSLVSSQVGAIPSERRARWDFPRRLSKALDLLCADPLNALISGETAFRDLAKAFPATLADPETLCHRIRY